MSNSVICCLDVRPARDCCAPTWFGLARAWKKRFSVRKQYCESAPALDTDPDPVFTSSRLDPDLNSDLALLLFENSKIFFALFKSGYSVGLETHLDNYDTKSFSKSWGSWLF